MRKSLATVVTLLVLPVVLTACGGDDVTAAQTSSTSQEAPRSEAAKPASLNGSWKDDMFAATVAENSIEINIVDGDTTSLYWKGTFPADGSTVTSAADTAALESSILGSQDAEKTFKVTDDTITFDMTMMGTTKTVHLKRA